MKHTFSLQAYSGSEVCVRVHLFLFGAGQARKQGQPPFWRETPFSKPKKHFFLQLIWTPKKEAGGFGMSLPELVEVSPSEHATGPLISMGM